MSEFFPAEKTTKAIDTNTCYEKWRKNLKHMDKEYLAYSKGHNDYHDGYTLKDNPYKRFSSEWEAWKSGWNDEKSDDPYWEEKRKNYKNAVRRIKYQLKRERSHFL